MFSVRIGANENIIGLDDIPETEKRVKVMVYDEKTDNSIKLYVVIRDGKVSWFVKDHDSYIRVKNPTTLTGRKCIKQLPLQVQKAFNQTTVDFLRKICPDFKDLQEIIDRDMQIVPMDVRIFHRTSKSGLLANNQTIRMWNPVVEPEHRYRIIKGFMQSRKTWAIISTSMYYFLRYRLSTFIVVQNSLDACEQLMSRIKDVFEQYMSIIRREKREEQFDKLFRVLDCARGKTVNAYELEKAVNGCSPRIFVVIRNVRDITPINDMVEKLYTHRYVVMIDESDFNDSGSKSSVQTAIETFKERAGVVYDVTATPMTSIMKEDIDAGNVIVLSRPDGYKGITSIRCHGLKKPATYCNGVDNNPFVQDPNLKEYINDFAKTKPHRTKGQKFHPHYSLVRVGSVIKPQLRIAKWISRHHGDRIIAITYNGSSCGITLRGNMLPKKSIFLEDNTESKYENGVHHFGGLHIGKIIAWLQNNGGTDRYPRIMVLAGTLADRGISFGTSEWGECISRGIYPWHLTEMYFIPAKSMNQANLLQATGRLCGVYPDNIPLTLYTNAGKDIFRAFGLQEELIERARNANKVARLAKEIIPELAISQEKCSGRRITALRVPCRLHKVADDFVHGGFDWNVEGYSYNESDAKFGDGQRSKVPKTVISDDERERLRQDIEVKRAETIREQEESGIDSVEYNRLLKLFPRWAKKDNNIARFMRDVLDPRKKYTKTEIREEAESAGVRITDLHFSKGKKRIRYGNILQQIGNIYRLHPCLVEAFEKYFNFKASL